MTDLSPPPLWLPPKPAIIRPADADLARDWKHADARRVRQDSKATFPFPTFVPYVAPRALTYIGVLSSTTDTTSYTLSSFSFPRGGLAIIMHVGRNAAETSRTLSSITIAGGSVTPHVSSTGSNGTLIGCSSAVVSSGNVDVAMTYSANMSRCVAYAWLLENAASNTPVSTGQNSINSNVGSRTLTLDYPVNGLGIYMIFHGSTGTVTWSAATEASEDSIESTKFSTASKSIPAGATGNVETATFSTLQVSAIVGATWA